MNEQLKPYLDGELDSVNRIEFDSILAASPELQREAEEYRRISLSLKSADPGQPYGKEELLQKLSQPASSSSKQSSVSNGKLWRTAWMWSGSMACLIVVAMVMNSKKSSSFVSASNGEAAPMMAAGAMPDSVESAPAPASSLEGSTLSGDMSKEAPSTFEFKAEPSREQAKIPMVNGSTSLSGRVQAERNALETSDSKSSSVVGSLDTPAGIYVERQGDIQVKVEDLSQTVDLTVGIAKSLDGFVVSSNMSKREEVGEANVILRVPTSNFTTAINKIQAAGEVISMNNSSQDITSETVDSNTRMNYWAIEEQRLIAALNQAKPSRKWEIRQELSSVRANLEAQRAMVKSLRDRAKYSTITAKFISGDVSGKSNWARNTFKDAKSGLGSIGEVLGTVGIYALVFVPLWLPFAIVAYVIKKRQIR